MKRIKATLLTLMLLISCIFFAGCLNYREVDEFSIVAGVAVDKEQSGQYKLTAEVVKIGGGKDTKTTSELITGEGKTMFDAARNMISVSGKKLYWSHAKVLILSETVAREGVGKILDWYGRDPETREETLILVSQAETAREIFDIPENTEDIKSFQLGQIITNEKSLSKAPKTDILQFAIDSQSGKAATVIPTIGLKQAEKKTVAQIMGVAIIKDDKLAGMLDGEETKYLSFIKDEIKGGILTEEVQVRGTPTRIALEIFGSKTKTSPVIQGNDIQMNIDIETTVSIGEISGNGNFIEEEGRVQLEKLAGAVLKQRVEALIEKIKMQYGADIFGFGGKLREDRVKVWNSVSSNWNDVFKSLKINVTATVHIKNSAGYTRNLQESESS
ncbi:Ger(x)C family spore germination protein [Acetanaerobacterium elongatum]|uniref:Spore germination protein KC n=1 Tax=Acetanaerobacterium elongatum TaxID=258515 RepID=A0A1G9U008_9FIRM|nr:Ger(x)C family spore germination protein [Acetanaerobacterium elongatum]SDM53339.1 spore germination protein KC [Acetanaerobacterium elongatum]